jgi:hypothetical protein
MTNARFHSRSRAMDLRRATDADTVRLAALHGGSSRSRHPHAGSCYRRVAISPITLDARTPARVTWRQVPTRHHAASPTFGKRADCVGGADTEFLEIVALGSRCSHNEHALWWCRRLLCRLAGAAELLLFNYRSAPFAPTGML